MRCPSLKPVLLFILAVPLRLTAQSDVGALAERFIRMTAVTGFERHALDSVQRVLPGSHLDGAGNVVLDRGRGSATLIVCPFDEVGYVVGGIRDDGWLTLRRVGARAPSPLFDQYHEGQRIMLFGRRGALPGVIAVHSTHLQRGRSANEAPFNVDDAFVDIGATNGAEARAAGADILSPVAELKQVTRYGDGLLAGPFAGRRAACAALVTAAIGSSVPDPGRIVVAIAVEQELGQRGLRTLANVAGPFDRTLIIDGASGSPGSIAVRSDTVVSKALPRLGTVMRWSLPTRNSGTSVETVSLADIAALRSQLAARIGGGK